MTNDLKIDWGNLPALWTAFQEVGDQAVWVANYFSAHVCDTSGIDYGVCALAPLAPAFGQMDDWFRDMDNRFTTHWNGLEEATAATIKHIDAVDKGVAQHLERYTSEIEISNGKIVTYDTPDITAFHLVDIHDSLTEQKDGKDQLDGKGGKNGDEGHDKDFMKISEGYDKARDGINDIVDTINDVSPLDDIPRLPDKSLSEYLVYPLSGNYKRLQRNAASCRQVGTAMTTWQHNITKVAAKSHTAFEGRTAAAFTAQLGLYGTVMEGVQVACNGGGKVLDNLALVSEKIAVRVERAIVALGKALFRLAKKVAAKVSGIVAWFKTAVDVITKGTEAFNEIVRDVKLVIGIISNIESLVEEVKKWADLQAKRLQDFKELVTAVEKLPPVASLTSLKAVEQADAIRVRKAVDALKEDFKGETAGSEKAVLDKIDHVLKGTEHSDDEDKKDGDKKDGDKPERKSKPEPAPRPSSTAPNGPGR